MALSSSYNQPVMLATVRNPLMMKLQTDSYIKTLPVNSTITLRFLQPQAPQEAINITVDGQSFSLKIVNSSSLSGGNDYDTIWSGWGTPFNQQTFQAQYIERMMCIPFLDRNFNITAGSIDVTTGFRIILTAKEPGAVLNATLNLGTWIFVQSIANGVKLETEDNYVINGIVDVESVETNQKKSFDLYAYPVVKNFSDQPEAIIWLDQLIDKAITNHALQSIRNIFPLLNADYAPVFSWPIVLPFNHFLAKVTVRYWEVFGEPPVDRIISFSEFYALSAALPMSELPAITPLTLLRRWLTYRPMVHYTTRAADGFIYFATWKDDPVTVKVLLKIYRGFTLVGTIEAFNAAAIPSGEAQLRPFQIWQLSTNFFRHELADNDDLEPLTHYSFQIVNGANNAPLSQPYTLILTDPQPNYSQPFAQLVIPPNYNHYQYRIWFLNSFNTWETLTVDVPFEKKLETKGEEMQRPQTWESFNREIDAQFENETPLVRSVYQASTGYKDGKRNTQLAEELMMSKVVILEDGQRRIAINIKRETFKVWNDLDFMHEITFEFTVAHLRKSYDKW